MTGETRRAPATAPASATIGRWQAAWSLAAIVAITLLVSLAPAPNASLLREEAHNAGHVVVFAIFALLLLPLVSQRLRRTPALLATLLAALAAGIATEAAQSLLGGDPSIGDVLRDLWGTGVGLLAWLALHIGRNGAHARSRRLLWLAAAGALLLGLAPLLDTLRLYHERTQRLPLLLDANVAASLQFTKVGAERKQDGAHHRIAIPAPWAERAGEFALDLRLDSGRWPGLTLEEPAPDWRGWRSLSLELVNPGAAALELVLRVDDMDSGNEYEQRFNASLALPAASRRRIVLPLAQVVQTPSGRPLDLAHIRKLILFHDGAAPGGRVLVVRVALAH